MAPERSAPSHVPLASMVVRAGQGQRPVMPQANRRRVSPALPAIWESYSSRTLREREEIVRLNSVHCCLDVLVSAVGRDDDLGSDA